MPTYEYECGQCGLRFERQQGIKDPPLTQCPECEGAVRRVISGGGGFLLKGAGGSSKEKTDGCAYEQSGTTCCGLNAPCGKGCGSEK